MFSKPVTVINYNGNSRFAIAEIEGWQGGEREHNHAWFASPEPVRDGQQICPCGAHRSAEDYGTLLGNARQAEARINAAIEAAAPGSLEAARKRQRRLNALTMAQNPE